MKRVLSAGQKVSQQALIFSWKLGLGAEYLSDYFSATDIWTKCRKLTRPSTGKKSCETFTWKTVAEVELSRSNGNTSQNG